MGWDDWMGWLSRLGLTGRDSSLTAENRGEDGCTKEGGKENIIVIWQCLKDILFRIN